MRLHLLILAIRMRNKAKRNKADIRILNNLDYRIHKLASEVMELFSKSDDTFPIHSAIIKGVKR